MPSVWREGQKSFQTLFSPFTNINNNDHSLNKNELLTLESPGYEEIIKHDMKGVPIMEDHDMKDEHSVHIILGEVSSRR